MANKERLLILADKVEGYENFNQGHNDHCTIKLAEDMIDESGEYIHLRWKERVAVFLDITSDEVSALFVGRFGDLNIGMENCADMDDVTREQAAEALRRLATRG